MPDRICVECGELRKHKARGYCKPCYQKRMYHGLPLLPRSNLPWPENLLARMEPQPNGCIYYTSDLNADGYGVCYSPSGMGAHRAAWTHFVGPIPEGMTVGHKCHDADATCVGGPTCLHRRCVNWEHLALEAIGDNCRSSQHTVASINAAKTHCPHGHPYDEENTYRYRGARGCRICRNEATERYKAKRRGAAE